MKKMINWAHMRGIKIWTLYVIKSLIRAKNKLLSFYHDFKLTFLNVITAIFLHNKIFIYIKNFNTSLKSSHFHQNKSFLSHIFIFKVWWCVDARMYHVSVCCCTGFASIHLPQQQRTYRNVTLLVSAYKSVVYV